MNQPLKTAETPATLYLKHNYVYTWYSYEKKIFLNTFNNKSLHKDETKTKRLLINCTIKCLLRCAGYLHIRNCINFDFVSNSNIRF